MDAPVQFLLENLSNLIKYKYELISSAEDELQDLTRDLRALRAILGDAPGMYKKGQLFKEWERQIRETVCDVEDIIDSCITHKAIEHAKRNFVTRNIAKVNRTSSLAEQVRSTQAKVRTRFQDTKSKFLPNLDRADTPDTAAVETRRIRQEKRKNKIIGFEDETATLINCLIGPSKSNQVDVVSIHGMPGLGKTTIAWKIFEDKLIQYEFPVRIWVNISDDLNIRDVLLTILSKLSQKIADNTSEDDLADMVKISLSSGKFLIVMDDVWTKAAWDRLKSFLPMSNNEGRVLITSREEKVAYHANVNRIPHKLRFLTPDESWELLRYEVYEGQADAVPGELAGVGFHISKSCDGLPLSIVVMGGILKDKIADAHGIVESIKKGWEDVSARIQTYLVVGDPAKLLDKIVRLSYEKLPYELRDCFLYLGMFPEDASIPAKKLTLLWIAEGFIQQTSDSEKSMEEIASDNLKDLINRNLLMVEKSKPTGEAKICRVHDTIRQFCRTEAKFENQNLFQEVSWSTNRGDFRPLLNEVDKCRRLCIHSSVDKFLKKKPKLHKARTFLCFSKSPIELEAKDIMLVTDAFYLLRVLDAENIKFPKFPRKLGELIHLRYLTLTFTGDKFTGDKTQSLPKIISDLWNLQTLIVDMPARTLDIQANIWIMRHLRHLKSKASIDLQKDGKGEGGDNLQTLERLSPLSCTESVFNSACNLVKLGVQGDLSSVLGSKNFERLERLKKLKLVHERGTSSLCSLPISSRFPPNLKILVLAGTHLHWKQMPVLMDLGSLEALKLKESAFTGDSWEVGTGGFKNLELLDIERTDLKIWTASEASFRQLRFLSLKNCERIEEAPFELCKKLEMLNLERVTKNVVSSAKLIAKAKGGDFKLKVAPADDNPKAH